MKPGATAQPDASSSRAPRRLGTDLADHAVRDRDVGHPTGRAAPVEDGSAADDDVSRHRSFPSCVIDHELEQIAVGIARVHARCLGPTTAFPRHRALDDIGAGVVEADAQRFR